MHHVHLPKLADSGLVEWDRDTRTVEATDRPGEDAQRSERAAPIDDRFPADPSGDDGHRREILDIVESGSGPVSRETLARELASSEADGQPTEARIAEVAVDLHHRRLPRLREAGHVEYDVDDGVVKRA